MLTHPPFCLSPFTKREGHGEQSETQGVTPPPVIPEKPAPYPDTGARIQTEQPADQIPSPLMGKG